MYDSKLVTKILISILSNNHKFNAIQQDTGISPRIVRKYLDRMKREGLINEKTKNWTLGKSKPSDITPAGIEWLINTSLFDFLKSFSSIFNNSSTLKELKKPKNREVFRKTRGQKYSQTISLARKYFIECAQKKVDPFEELKSLDEWEYKIRFRIIDIDQILLEALKNLFKLIIYFQSNQSWEETEQIINTHWQIFKPEMRPFFGFPRGVRPDLDLQLQQIYSEV